ncbi:hypothetical protein G6010_04240 [Dietzia sp. SLG510A3-3B2-2]|nr:hypothetical protein [Dietzia sp. SLG510A3-40A3]MBB1008810.1 hypothetical protein [Dietzia sp. SLG510A3-3B2-2]
MNDRMQAIARRTAMIPRLRHSAFRLFTVSDLITRRDLPGQLAELTDYHQNGTIHDFTEAGERYLQRILRVATQCSPYYRDAIQPSGSMPAFGSAEWSEIPLLDRETLRNNMDTIRTLPQNCGFVQSNTTGGSTGEPLRIDYLGGHDGEHQEFLWELNGYEPGDLILALDGTVIQEEQLRASRYWTVKNSTNLPYGSMALSSHYFSSETEDAYVDFLIRSRPAFLRGYPSFIHEIAKAFEKRSLRLDVKGVQLTSESHFEYQIKVIEKTLGPCFDQYGHAEASVFGYSSPDDSTIYCAPTYGLVEVLDSNGRHVSEGDVGDIVVTGFHNFAMPLIRYKTGDRGKFRSREHGITTLSSIEGRTQDVVYSHDGQAHRLTALVFGRHYAAFDSISRWQILQRELGSVTFRIVRDSGYSKKDEMEISDTFDELAGIKCEFSYVDHIDRTPRGKSKLLIQEVL